MKALQNLTILTDFQACSLLRALPAPFDLIGDLMYRTGLRLQDALELRVKDLNLDSGTIYVRRVNGANDRVIAIPAELRADLRSQLEMARKQHAHDLRSNIGVILPVGTNSLLPLAHTRWCWQHLFPSPVTVSDPATGEPARAPLSASSFQRAIQKAAQRAGLDGWVHSHSLRHAFAARLVERNEDLRTIQERLGHDDIKTTARYARELEAAQSRNAMLSIEPDRTWITHFKPTDKPAGFFARLRAMAAVL